MQERNTSGQTHENAMTQPQNVERPDNVVTETETDVTTHKTQYEPTAEKEPDTLVTDTDGQP